MFLDCRSLKLTFYQSQVDLDEEFARSLVMQDEQHLQDRGARHSQRGGDGGGVHTAFSPTSIGNLPYEPRVRNNRPANQNSGGQWEPPAARNEQRIHREGENPPGMLAVEAKVNQFAEGTSFPPFFTPSTHSPVLEVMYRANQVAAGQTFSSFFNKAKAKISEFQENQQQRQTENAGINARESNWGMEQQQSQYHQNQGQGQGWTAPGGGRGGQGRTPQGQQGMWGDSAS